MKPERVGMFCFALECAAFELNQVRKMAAEEKRFDIALNIERRVEEIDELANLIRYGRIEEVVDEA